MTKSKGKIKKIIIFAYLIILLFWFSVSSSVSINTNVISDNKLEVPTFDIDDGKYLKKSYYDNSMSPIVIDDTGGGDYTWEEAANEDWCTKIGDTYVIENLTIDASGHHFGIHVNNSNAFFRIKNCTIYGAGSETFNSGIQLQNTTNGELINNNCSFNLNGIISLSSKFNTISGNIANNNSQHGIGLAYSNKTVVTNNVANNNTYFGIILHHGHNNTILGNNASRNTYFGIYLEYSYNNTIMRNYAAKNDNSGIYLDCSHNNSISENTAINNNNHGVIVGESNFNSITENNVSNNGEVGIVMCGSNSNKLSRNIVYKNHDGILITNCSSYYCEKNNISKTLIANNTNYGILIETNNNYTSIFQNAFIGNEKCHAWDNGSHNNWNNSFIGNYWDNYTGVDAPPPDGIGDDPYTYIQGSANSIDYLPIFNSPVHGGETIHIDDTGVHAHDWAWTVLMKLWCYGLGTKDDPYIIKDLTIDASSHHFGIHVNNSNAYFKIKNCTVYGAGTSEIFNSGIQLQNTTNGQLINNNCSLNQNGIITLSSKFNTISGNIANNNSQHGIGLAYSNKTVVSNNEANKNSYFGIIINTGRNNTILENAAGNNTYFGIYLEYSVNNTILRNHINDNKLYGICLDHSSNLTTVSENEILKNDGIGLFINVSSNNSIIYNNRFKDNGLNAMDNGTNNQWNKGTLGNYWKDYPGEDKNDDGIGDTPYDIPGTAGSKDNYPIWDDGPEVVLLRPRIGGLNLNLGFSFPPKPPSPAGGFPIVETIVFVSAIAIIASLTAFFARRWRRKS